MVDYEFIKEYIRDIPDFPIEGIIFKDITPLLQHADAFSKVIDAFYERYKDKEINAVVSADARGFIFGAPLALRLGVSFVPVRKPGKLPYKTVEATYKKEYGTDTLCMHEDAIKGGDRVLIIDDLLATGGTVAAMIELVEKLGGTVVEAGFVIGLSFLNGEQKLSCPVFSMIQY